MNADLPSGGRAAWNVMTRAGHVAALLAAAAAAVFLFAFWPFLTAVFGPSPKPPEVAAAQQHAEQQKKAFESYLAQIDGRSLFVLPAPPKDPEPEPIASDEPSKPPPPPSVYGGPAIVAMLSDTVWFSGGKKLKLGEKSDDLEVISLSPPWEARLKWKDVEFTVNFFDRNKLAKAPDGTPAEAISPEAKAAPDQPPPPKPKPAEPPTPPQTPPGSDGGPPPSPDPSPAPAPPPPGDGDGDATNPPPPPREEPRRNQTPLTTMAFR